MAYQLSYVGLCILKNCSQFEAAWTIESNERPSFGLYSWFGLAGLGLAGSSLFIDECV